MAVTGLERHVWARPEGELYPRRVIHTKDFVYIRNYEPKRWPMGSADFKGSHQGNFSDVDGGPSKSYLLKHGEDKAIKPYFEMAFSKRPEDELYAIQEDPAQLENLASNPEYASIKNKLRTQMEDYLKQTGDPRMNGETPWKAYPFYSNGKKYLKGEYLKEVENQSQF